MLIQDIGPWDRYPTITNDAEYVVAEVIEDERMRVVHHGEPLQPPLGTDRRLFYIDSEGDTSELLVVDGAFVGFRVSANWRELVAADPAVIAEIAEISATLRGSGG